MNSSMLSNFLNTSIASLSIYDVFVVILFTLVLILCVVSAIIIISSHIKKMGVEINKHKNIQEIQEKIICNRLDLILNKLDNSISLSNLTNQDIKKALITNINNDNISMETIRNSNETIQEQKLQPYNTDQQNISSNIAEDKDLKISTNPPQNIIALPPCKDEIQSKEPEYINIKQESLPQNIHLEDIINVDNTEHQTAEQNLVPINESSNKKTDICIEKNNESTSGSTEELANNTNFEHSTNIPITQNNKEDNISFYEDDKEAEEINDKSKNGIALANKILNNLSIFSNEEKFDITSLISEDGRYIESFTNNDISKLTKHELIKQLFIQSLLNIYNYPIDNIEDNYITDVENNIYRKVDIAVFNKFDCFYILVLINTKSEKINFKSLSQLAKLTKTSFIVWTNGNKIFYYKNLHGKLIEVSNIPPFNINMYPDNNNFNPQHHKNYSHYDEQNLNQHTSQPFARDVYNIFKRQPFNLSNNYQSIMSQYKNFGSLNNNINRQPFNRNNYYNAGNNNQIPKSMNNRVNLYPPYNNRPYRNNQHIPFATKIH